MLPHHPNQDQPHPQDQPHEKGYSQHHSSHSTLRWYLLRTGARKYLQQYSSQRWNARIKPWEQTSESGIQDRHRREAEKGADRLQVLGWDFDHAAAAFGDTVGIGLWLCRDGEGEDGREEDGGQHGSGMKWIVGWS